MRWFSAPFDSERLPRDKGAYVLELELLRGIRLRFCASRPIAIAPGVVRYYGSARGSGGLRARLARHLRSLSRETPRHWHIDHLLQHRSTRLMRVGVAIDGEECALCAADAARGWSPSELPFGATDCRSGCDSHLLIEGTTD